MWEWIISHGEFIDLDESWHFWSVPSRLILKLGQSCLFYLAEHDISEYFIRPLGVLLLDTSKTCWLLMQASMLAFKVSFLRSLMPGPPTLLARFWKFQQLHSFTGTLVRLSCDKMWINQMSYSDDTASVSKIYYSVHTVNVLSLHFLRKSITGIHARANKNIKKCLMIFV